MLSEMKYHWFKLIPETDEMKQGKLAIEFAISKEGRVAHLCLVAISGDVALDRAAWNGITSSNPLIHFRHCLRISPGLSSRCGFVFTTSVEGDKEAA
jgi:outer membrane biosynthesis protein TonB